MRVLHLYSGNLFGGIETMLVSLARHRDICVDIRHEVALCFDGRLRRELDATGIPVHMLPAPRASRPDLVARARRALRDLLARESYAAIVCHAPWSHAFFGSIARRSGAPLVFWAHDVAGGRHWTERLARRVPPDLVICNSHYTQTTLHAMYPGVPSLVVRYPIDVVTLPFAAEVRADVRAELRTTDETTVIVIASRMEPLKGHETLLRGLAAVDERVDWTCWIAGGAQRPQEATYRATLEELAATLRIASRVRFVGERRDVPRLFAAADIHCQPNSRPDAFGIAFIEAMAAGLPVVTTNIGGGAEIVDASCGVLIDVGDVTALAATMTALARDCGRRARLGDAARQRARDLCDPARQMNQLAGALRDLATSMAPI